MVPLCVLVVEITFNRQYKDILINETNLEKGNDEKKGFLSFTSILATVKSSEQHCSLSPMAVARNLNTMATQNTTNVTTFF